MRRARKTVGMNARGMIARCCQELLAAVARSWRVGRPWFNRILARGRYLFHRAALASPTWLVMGTGWNIWQGIQRDFLNVIGDRRPSRGHGFGQTLAT